MVGNNDWVKLTVLDISKKRFLWLKWGKWVVFGLRININFFLNLFTSLDLMPGIYEWVKEEHLDF